LTAWQTAAKALLLIGQNGGPEMLARIGMMKALYPEEPDQKPGPRRKRAKKHRIIGRDDEGH
jgi:hypothetical protein